MRGALAAALAAALLGCSPDDAPAPQTPPPPAPVPREATPPEALAPGAVRVRSEGGLVDFEANGATRADVLAEIAAATGLVLEGVGLAEPERRITARIEAASPADVLALVLRGVDFSLEMRFDPAGQHHRVALLRLGADAPAEPDPLVAALFELLDSEEPEVVLAALAALERAGDPSAAPEIEPLLDDEDPAVREAAAEVLDELLLDDEAP